MVWRLIVTEAAQRYSQVRFLQASLLPTMWQRDAELPFRSQIPGCDWSCLSDFTQANLFKLLFFSSYKQQFKNICCARDCQLYTKIHFSFYQTRLQFQISLEADVFVWLRSCWQNVSTCDICDLSLLDQGPLLSGWIPKSLCRMEPHACHL